MGSEIRNTVKSGWLLVVGYMGSGFPGEILVRGQATPTICFNMNKLPKQGWFLVLEPLF